MSFNFSASTANAVFYRSYSRRQANGFREDWNAVTDRTLQALTELGSLNSEEYSLIYEMQTELKTLPSGRWLWVGGSDWSKNPKNYFGCYNCSSTDLIDFKSFGLLMSLAMQGCGTGAVIEPKYIEKLPTIKNTLNVKIIGKPGDVLKENRLSDTSIATYKNRVNLIVGDSRKGWVTAYQSLLELASSDAFEGYISLVIDVSNVRPKGEKLKGFGGTANPIKLSDLFIRVSNIINKAVGRQLTSVECCLIMSEAAVTIVAGNIRRSASIMQFDSNDTAASKAKDNLWQQDDQGNWKIDPERDALRMGNHTRVFHTKPTFDQVLEAVSKQFYSGEGAIQYAGEAIARSNADLLNTEKRKNNFIASYEQSPQLAREYLRTLAYKNNVWIDDKELDHRMGRYGLNPCGEITMKDNMCNLSEIHLNQIDPFNFEEQAKAFKAGAISAAVLLHHKFEEERYQYSREIDPIVGVSFTGLFDFFVKAFGADWLEWWQAGRPDNFFLDSIQPILTLDKLAQHFCVLQKVESNDFREWNVAKMWLKLEEHYLTFWKQTVEQTVKEYCEKHGLRVPNRCTTVQPAGCLDKTALRVFDQGLIYADEVVNPGSGEHEGIDLSVRSGIRTDKAIANEPLNLVKVTLANGRILRMTQNHRLSINSQWVYAADMQPGMKIDYSLGEYTKVKEASLIPVNYERYTRESRSLEKGHARGVLSQTIKTPSTMTPDLAYFLGCLFGNGCLSLASTRVRFSHGNVKVLSCLSAIGLKLFGIEGVISDDPRGDKKELTFGSKHLFDWLLMNNLAKEPKSKDLDRIPYAVRTSSRESILSFFCGLIDTDGCVKAEGSLSIDSSSEKFLRNLQQIAEAVGLSFSVFHNTKGENMQAEKDMHGLCLSRMVSIPESLEYLNKNSVKCATRPLPSPKRMFKFDPYKIVSVEFETTPDFSYDFAVDGVDDDDSWYWQGGLKSHNSKSLLTGASSGWHPPKAARYIRRITFAKDDAIALALMDYGYSVVPSQSDKDENGVLLNDPFDPRCTEWLVEIPVSVSWADLPGCDQIDISKFSIEAQYDFYMQVQRHYTTHNTSATLEIRENEIETLAKLIHTSIQNNEGYVSAAVLARFDSLETFPRLPFEPIGKEVYEQLSKEVLLRRKGEDFLQLLNQYDKKEVAAFDQGAAACDSDKCLLPLADPNKSKESFVFKGFEPVK
jgi:ribonucleotide reductase, class II